MRSMGMSSFLCARQVGGTVAGVLGAMKGRIEFYRIEPALYPNIELDWIGLNWTSIISEHVFWVGMVILGGLGWDVAKIKKYLNITKYELCILYILHCFFQNYKITKYELWNLYTTQNKTNEVLNTFVISNIFQTFPNTRKYFDIVGLLCKTNCYF